MDTCFDALISVAVTSLKVAKPDAKNNAAGLLETRLRKRAAESKEPQQRAQRPASSCPGGRAQHRASALARQKSAPATLGRPTAQGQAKARRSDTGAELDPAGEPGSITGQAGRQAAAEPQQAALKQPLLWTASLPACSVSLFTGVTEGGAARQPLGELHQECRLNNACAQPLSPRTLDTCEELRSETDSDMTGYAPDSKRSRSAPLSHSGSSDQEEDGSTPKRARLTGFAAPHAGTSDYRGVSWHTQTRRWKAQIKVGGKDVNLGRHKHEEAAARAYDRAAICARGVKEARLNFVLSDYDAEVAQLTSMPLEVLAASLRGVEERVQAQTSRYHGVRLNKRTRKWEAYIRVAGKHVHLGCHATEVAAAQAFDQAAIVRHAHNLGAVSGQPKLVTNFPPEYYQEMLHSTVATSEAAVVSGVFHQLEEKYVQNLLDKCRQQAGASLAAPASATGSAPVTVL